MKHLKNFVVFENFNIEDNELSTIFRNLDSLLPVEKVSLKGLRESLELIGDGEITVKEYDKNHLMYKEMINNNSEILVIHARFDDSPYGGDYGYVYEIGIYNNDPRTEQLGGGYDASGTVSIKHTQLFAYSDYDKVHFNKQIISKVIDYIYKKRENKDYKIEYPESHLKISVGDMVNTNSYYDHPVLGERICASGKVTSIDGDWYKVYFDQSNIWCPYRGQTKPYHIQYLKKIK
jgi:hypothetical protein